jgi:hypothetical protein
MVDGNKNKNSRYLIFFRMILEKHPLYQPGTFKKHSYSSCKSSIHHVYIHVHDRSQLRFL